MRSLDRHTGWIRAAGAILAALPGAAEACPVCFGNGNPRVLEAYYVSVAFLSALPLVLLGGVAWWLYAMAKRSRSPMAHVES